MSLLVSVIVPIYNASSYLSTTLNALSQQIYRPLEVIFIDDASTDQSLCIVKDWACNENTIRLGISIKIASNHVNHGPGFSRNEAVLLSSGSLICHFDADDDMHAERIAEQVQMYLARGDDRCIIGCNIFRDPDDSTPYYTNWVNSMTEHDIYVQRFRECTIVCPTWLYSRANYDRVASHCYNRYLCKLASDDGTHTPFVAVHPNRAFVESTPAFLIQEKISRVPEDLIFFLDHLECGGRLLKVPKVLVNYRSVSV